MALALGLMSGTSADGISATVASFKNRSFSLMAYDTFPYPKKVREKILKGPSLRVPEVAELHFELGQLLAHAALKILRHSRLSRQRIEVIGSHGQTLYHGPRDRVPVTFQIGEAGVIAEKTGLPVVSDFRPQDVALRGEGAPLVPYFDFFFYGRGPVRAFQNIGGIANVTVVGKPLSQPVAFDNGPGNCLMDLAVQKITRGRLRYDPGGRLARRGHIVKSWLDRLLAHPFLGRRPPKSLDRSIFGSPLLARIFRSSLSSRPWDVLATLTYFTALTIYESLTRFSPRAVREVIVSGGGIFNQTLMGHLKTFFSPVPVRSIEELGIPAQAKEPLAFAFFALRALKGQPNHLPQVTGAFRQARLGKITFP